MIAFCWFRAEEYFSAKMISIRFVFLIVGISILSSAVFGGESPNEDRIGDILAMMTRMDSKINGIKSDVATMSSKIKEVEQKVEEVSIVINNVSF